VTPEQQRDLALIGAAFAAALVASLALTPLAIRVARRVGAIDEPDSGRRVHRQPVARAGGWAVAVAFAGVGAAAIWLTSNAGMSMGHVLPVTLTATLGGVLAAAAMGFVDDRWQIRARWQFVSQLILAGVAVAAGITVGFVYNPLASAGASAQLVLPAWLSMLVTAFWIVGMINSINFIDGLDGLSSGIALIAAVTLGILSLSQGEPAVALLCGVLAGALAGFLPWNFHPARVFTGTTGVMAVGFALGVLSILGTAKYAVALLVLGVPIIDTFWIIIRRVAHRQSPFTPDRGHLHHRLLDLGLTHRGAVLVIYAICAALAVLSLVLSTAQQLYTFVGFVVGGGLLLYLLTRRSSDDLEADSYPDPPPPDPDHLPTPEGPPSDLGKPPAAASKIVAAVGDLD
jgi:UDP-GlcNAc:undecaprenyl-phosphate/decaprenyl-phosphate GlcNAc-1-phosphate transferase